MFMQINSEIIKSFYTQLAS